MPCVLLCTRALCLIKRPNPRLPLAIAKVAGTFSLSLLCLSHHPQYALVRSKHIYCIQPCVDLLFVAAWNEEYTCLEARDGNLGARNATPD
jgi:hypothetical protein